MRVNFSLCEIYQPPPNKSWVDVVFYLLVASLPLENILANALGIEFSPSRVIALLFIAAVYSSIYKNNTFIFPYIIICITVPILISGIHAIASDYTDGFPNLLSMVLNVFILLATYKYTLERWQQIVPALLVFLFMIHLTSIVTIIYFGSGILYLDERLRYLDLDPNNIGLFASLGLIVSVVLLGTSLINSRIKFLLGALSLSNTLIIVSVASRTALMVPILTGIYYIIVSGSRTLLIKIFLLLAIFGFVVYVGWNYSEIAQDRWNRTFNESAINKYGNRDIVFEAALDLISQKPILGWGESDGLRALGSSLNFRRFGTHNSFLFFLLTSGILGLITFVLFLYYPFAQWGRLKYNNEYIILSTFIVFNIFALNSLDWHLSKHLWLFYGCFIGIHKLLCASNILYLPSYSKNAIVPK